MLDPSVLLELFDEPEPELLDGPELGTEPLDDEGVGDVTPELVEPVVVDGESLLLVDVPVLLEPVWVDCACAAPAVSAPVRTSPETANAAKCFRDVARRDAREVSAELFIPPACRSKAQQDLSAVSKGGQVLL